MIAVVREPAPLVRLMKHSDVPAIVRIENSIYPYPWSAAIFRDCLLAGYHSVALEQRGGIIGYAIMSVAAAEAHLLNLCVDECRRRLGHGGMLLEYLLHQAADAGAERIYLEVRPTNTAALRLYRDTGFVELGFRKDYYRASGGREDALVLARRLPGYGA